MDKTENDFSKSMSNKNFSEPWHANLFALTISLSESGVLAGPSGYLPLAAILLKTK